MLSNEQFEKARRLALRLAGLELGNRHRELLEQRSRRNGLSNGAELDSLLDSAESGDPQAVQRLIGLLTTHFTGFFRQPRQLQMAADHLARAAARRGFARGWSAAAATGEEVYSLAMVLVETCGSDEPPVRIIASDVDERALAKAERGEFSDLALRPVDSARRDRFFQRSGHGRSRISLKVRNLVEFRPLNLIDEHWWIEGEFDTILCRNVLMYLQADSRHHVLQRMALQLAGDGLLIIDPAEHLGKAAHHFGPGADGIYPAKHPSDTRRAAPAARSGP